MKVVYIADDGKEFDTCADCARYEMEQHKKEMRKNEIICYSPKDIDKYRHDLRYWSNSVGELHMFGEYDIEEEDLPTSLSRCYHELFEEDKDGNYCYLVNFKGENGIALINEYHEMVDGVLDANNYVRAKKVAMYMASHFDYPVILAQELGCPLDGDNATEVVVFMPHRVSKEDFDRVSKTFAQIAYINDPLF